MRNLNIQEEFYEKQYFRGWNMWFCLAVMIGVGIYVAVKIFGKVSLWEFILQIAIIAAVLMFLIFITLQTIVNQHGIFVKMFPFMWKFKLYSWENIAECKIEKYNPLIETSGWGYRFGYNFIFSKGVNISYNLSGNTALKLLLKNGRKVLIGTKQGVKMQEFLQELNKI